MSDLKTIAIKGKPYVQVKDRLKYFRENFKGYALISELVEVTDRSALIRAVVKNEKGEIVATGTSFERADAKGSLVNATSHVENCESSAWGRALGNFGIGIDDSVASADEVQHAEKKVAYNPPSDQPKKSVPDVRLIMEALTPCKDVKNVETIWKRAMAHKWMTQEMSDLTECKTNVLARIESKREAENLEVAANLIDSDPLPTSSPKA